MSTLDPLALARNMMALSDEETIIALNWLERVAGAEADDIDRALLASVIDGTMDFSVAHGEMQFRLTAQGRARAEALIANSVKGQDMFAALRDATRVDGPKDPQ